MFGVKSDWKFLVAFYVLTSGLWGFFLKLISQKLDWKTNIIYVWIGFSAIYIIFLSKNVNFGLSKFHGLALATGIIAALGTMAFYKALSLAPGSLVIPFSAQYILVSTLLCIVFLKEPLSLRIIAGIICSVTAIALLSS
jgi:uncharacterized membrane protein